MDDLTHRLSGKLARAHVEVFGGDFRYHRNRFARAMLAAAKEPTDGRCSPKGIATKKGLAVRARLMGER